MAGEDDGNTTNGRRRRRTRRSAVRLSKLYSYACGRRPSVADDHYSASRIGGPGFSRVVMVNAGAGEPPAPAAADLQQQQMASASSTNSISTTKYNLFTFLPKSLFEQFRRVANIYFLLSAGIAYSPLAAYSSSSAIAPLVIVLVATMIKEAIEDWRRNQQVYSSLFYLLAAFVRHSVEFN